MIYNWPKFKIRCMETSSFRDSVKSKISEFLYTISFDLANNIKQSIVDELVDVVNQLSDYYEEGTHLYPEIVLLRSFEEFKATIPCFYHVLYCGKYEPGTLQRSLKMCAPLAHSGWHIFMELNAEDIRWGVVNGEQSVTSVSILNQIVGSETSPFVYIRNIGSKTVELCSGNSSYKVSLSLKQIDDILRDELKDLCRIITMSCSHFQEVFFDFLFQQINSALQKGHGNLIVVVDIDKAQKIPEVLKEGVIMESPLNLYGLFLEFMQGDKELYTHELLQKNSILLESMLNHDGITVFTTSGKVLGYHFIVDNNTKTSEQLNGGARTKAFSKLCQSMDKGIEAVFMKTQEGTIKFKTNGK